MEGGQHHHRPSALAVADDAGLALGLGMQFDHALQELRLGSGDVLDRLAGHRVRQEADEVAGMACRQRDPDLAVRLEAADPWSMPGARIDHDERPLLRIDRRRPSAGGCEPAQ